MPPPMGRRLRRAVIAFDLLRAQREGATGLDRRQGARLSALVAHARASSPFYRVKYRELPDQPSLRELPVVSKPELMGAFDDWVTDPQVNRAGVEAFIADRARIGTRYLGRYFVCRTSGTTGHPGLFVHDALA